MSKEIKSEWGPFAQIPCLFYIKRFLRADLRLDSSQPLISSMVRTNNTSSGTMAWHSNVSTSTRTQAESKCGIGKGYELFSFLTRGRFLAIIVISRTHSYTRKVRNKVLRATRLPPNIFFPFVVITIRISVDWRATYKFDLNSTSRSAIWIKTAHLSFPLLHNKVTRLSQNCLSVLARLHST